MVVLSNLITGAIIVVINYFIKERRTPYMELIRVVKRGLKEDGEGPADKYVKQMLINKVQKLDVINSEEVIKRIQLTYDFDVIINSLKLIDEGIMDKALQAYINE